MKQNPQERKALSDTAASTGTVSRALQLLTVLADAGRAVTVKYVSETMQLPPSTVHRLLQLMRTEGFVESAAEGRLYTVGRQFYRVAARVMASTSPADRAQPLLHELALTHDETVLFGLYLPTERAMCFAARADGHQMLKYEIELHRPLSLVWGASGKAILAFLPENIVRTILASEGPSPGSGLAPPPFTQLERELRRVREQGYSVSESQKLPDARGIAAPVFGPAGVLGCICLTSPRSRALRDSVEAVAKDVATHAAAFSRDLGAQPARHD